MNTSAQPALIRPSREANGVEVGQTPKAASMSKIEVSGLNFYYATRQALYGISLGVPEKKITALIGPSGCGKSTFLRTLNRMHETVRHTRVEGEVRLDGADIFSLDVTAVRRRVGMVFQKSNPFPKTIFENVAYGAKIIEFDEKSVIFRRPSKTETEDYITGRFG